MRKRRQMQGNNEKSWMEKQSNEVYLSQVDREQQCSEGTTDLKKKTFTSLILVGCKKAEKSLIEAITEP